MAKQETKEEFRPEDKKGKKPMNPRKKQYDSKKGKGQRKPFKDEGEKKPRVENDPAFYFKYRELADNAARVAFNHRNGKAIQWELGGSTVKQNIDAILIYKWLPNPGVSNDSNSGINITSKSAWKMLNRRFRGVHKYQQSDFGIIQFCVLDFMVSLAEAERAYGLLTYYRLNNVQVPTTLLISMGLDPDSFTDLADFRLRLNRLITVAQTLCLVKGYSLLDHYILLASHIFKDRESERANLFSFVKQGFWLYDPTAPTGSSAVFFSYTKPTMVKDSSNTDKFALRTADSIIADLQLQLNALINDDDVDDVCSDILAFYGNREDAADIVRLGLVPEDYTVEAVYSDTINRQVHNATTFGSVEYDDVVPGKAPMPTAQYTSKIPSTFTQQGYNALPPMILYQEDNVIKFNPAYYQGSVTVHTVDTNYVMSFGGSRNQGAVIRSSIVDTDILTPTPEDVMEMTRNISYTSETSNSGHYAYLLDTASSVVILSAFQFWFATGIQAYSRTAVSAVDREYNIVLGNGTIGWIHTTLQSALAIETLTRFDWGMIGYYFQAGHWCVIGDLDNYVTFSADLIEELHDIAFLSEFKNPMIDAIIKE